MITDEAAFAHVAMRAACQLGCVKSQDLSMGQMVNGWAEGGASGEIARH
jgi:hypothetical protein